jgi:hypothetical protein
MPKNVTYRIIQGYVKLVFGFVPETCWIAHVKSLGGLTLRTAPNRLDPNSRANPCPDRRRPAIEQALRDLGVLTA